MKNSCYAVAIAAAISVSTSAMAMAETAPTKRLCAITSTVTCDLADCQRGPANAVNLPVFVQIDLEQDLVETATEAGDRRSSKVLGRQDEGDVTMLVGGELGNGWSMRLDRTTGSLNGAVASDGRGYIIFGSCLAH